MSEFCVYMHVCKENGKRYIGLTSQRPSARFGKNENGYSTCVKFYNAILKYGWDNFDHVIVADNLTKDEAQELEKDLVQKYNTTDDHFGYNIMPGGQVTEFPESVKEKISKSSIGKPGTITGQHRSKETKDKISAAQKGRKMSEQHYVNFCKAMAKRKGKPGHPMSDKNKQKLVDACQKKVKCVELNKVYNSYTEACNELGIQIGNLSKVIDKPNRTAGSYHFVSVRSECVTTIESAA